MLFINEKLILEQKKVLKHLLKSLGSNMIKGKSLVNISMPIDIFDTKSHLERLAGSFSLAPVFLEKAG